MKSDNTVYIWKIPLNNSEINWNQWLLKLSSDEKKAAMRFQFERHRRRYIIAHVAMREILSTYLNVAVEDVSIRIDQNGKPYLLNNPIYFNLSHSHDMALLGVSFHGNIGVDIEFVNSKLDVMGIAERFFSSEEFKQLQDISPENRHLHFYHCWSAKEAFLKAKGLGIANHLKMFALDIQDLNKIKIMLINQELKEFSAWFVQPLGVADGYIATLVSTVKPNSVIIHEFDIKNKK